MDIHWEMDGHSLGHGWTFIGKWMDIHWEMDGHSLRNGWTLMDIDGH